jgi:hypothetical protein
VRCAARPAGAFHEGRRLSRGAPGTNDRVAVKCPHYQPIAGGTRCVSFITDSEDGVSDGGCTRPDIFMCVLWLDRYSEPGWEDQAGRVWPVDEDGVVYITRRTLSSRK